MAFNDTQLSNGDAAMLEALMVDLRRPKLSKCENDRKSTLYYNNRLEEMLSGKRESAITDGQLARYPGTAVRVNDTKDQEFRARLKTIDNDLAEMIKIVHEGVLHYFENGEYPAPYYAWRIAVILRKNKFYQQEECFLTAFNKFFHDGNGARYQDLVCRAPKAKKLASKIS